MLQGVPDREIVSSKMLHQCNIWYEWLIVINPVIVRVHGLFFLVPYFEKKSESVTFICFTIKSGSVRNAGRIWVSTPQNRTYQTWG